MKTLILKLAVVGLILCPYLSIESNAQSHREEMNELKRMIEENRRQNEELMRKLEQLEAERGTEKQKIKQMEVERAQEKEKMEEFIATQERNDQAVDGLLKLWSSLRLGFYVDTTYQAAFHQPNDQDILLRTLYPDQNQFNFNAFTLTLAKDPKYTDEVWDLIGFHTDILFGEQAPRLASQGLGEFDEVDPYQAYLQAIAPVGNGIDFYAGRFVTLAGYEVIEARDDPNISRSILFGFAIPFTHTGIRSHYAAGPFDFSLGMNNGWDTTKNEDGNFTLESQIAIGTDEITPGVTDASLAVTGYFGKESQSLPEEETEGTVFDDWRNLLTVVGSVNLFDRLTLIAEADFGWQQGITSPELLLDDQQAFWWGTAGYAVVDLYKDLAHFALRGEYFKDRNRFRTFANDSLATKFYEITSTFSLRPFKGLGISNKYLDNLEMRAEFRWDHANDPYFLRKGTTSEGEQNLDKNQYELSAQLLYWFDLGEFEPVRAK